MPEEMSELRELLLELVIERKIIAIVDGDDIIFYHIEHTDDKMMEMSLNADELLRFWMEHDQ